MELLGLSIFSAEIIAILLLAKGLSRGKIRLTFILLPAVLIILQLLAVGLKWQLIPAYALVLFIAVSGLAKFSIPKFLRMAGICSGVLLIILSGALSYIFPLYQLPAPGGPYTVGTTYLHLTDTSRLEFISLAPEDHRELMVRVWYPSATVPTGKPYRYMPPTYATTFAQTKGFPGFMLSHLDLVNSHAFAGLSIAKSETPLPLIIFNHGYMWHSSMYTAQMEELASQGYVVFGIDFTYETPVSVFPNGEKRMFNQVFMDTIWQGLSFDYYKGLQDSFQQEQVPTKKIDLMRAMMEYSAFSQRIDHMALDVKFLLDEIAAMNANPSSPFFQQFDLQKVGVMGHSVGGAVAGVASASDPRIKAGINLDGTQWGSMIDTELDKPFLYMKAWRDAAHFDPGDFIYQVTASHDFYTMTIKGAEHVNFSDLFFWSRVPAITQAGPIEGNRVIDIVLHYTISFFDKYLKNKPVRLLERAHQEYPEISLRFRSREQQADSHLFSGPVGAGQE